MTGLVQEQHAANGQKGSVPLLKRQKQVPPRSRKHVPSYGKSSPLIERCLHALRRLKKNLFANSQSSRLKELINGLVDLGSFQSGEFTLASGKQSSLYVDLRLLISKPRLMQEAARVYANELKELECDLVAGIPYAALPIGAAVSLESGIPLIYNRKESKTHGLGKTMEGKWSEGERVVIIEDVITTGGSILSSVELFRSAGLVVEHAVVFLDRQQGGVENLKEKGVQVHSILDLQEVQEFLEQTGQFSDLEFPEASSSNHIPANESSALMLNGR